jgi:hypothetical protein
MEVELHHDPEPAGLRCRLETLLKGIKQGWSRKLATGIWEREVNYSFNPHLAYHYASIYTMVGKFTPAWWSPESLAILPPAFLHPWPLPGAVHGHLAASRPEFKGLLCHATRSSQKIWQSRPRWSKSYQHQ